jgi:hypothetical protein
LLRAGYTGSGLARLLRTGAALNVPAAESARARLLLEPTRTLDCLVTLLLLGDDLDAATAETALADDLNTLIDVGLVGRLGDIVRPLVQVIPHDDVLISSDRPSPEPDPMFVPGAQGPSDLLARLTPRAHVARALDLGTGCGIQAVLLRRHADDVVATDINERALEVARRNAALNLTQGIDFRLGDLLEPVRGEQFDLVVANPPYPISPEHTYVFRDAPVRGDELCRRLVEAVPAVLADGGIAVVLVSWVGTDKTPDPLEWAAASDCEALLLVTHVRSAIDDGLAWNQEHLRDADDYGDRVRRWWSFFAAEGIDAVAYGALVLRRSADESRWSAAVPFPVSAHGAAGHQVLRLLAAHRALSQAGGNVKAVGPLALADDAQISSRRQRDANGAWSSEYELRLSGGLGMGADLDAEGAAIIAAFESPSTATDALATAARQLGRSDSSFATEADSVIERALSAGFLELAD